MSRSIETLASHPLNLEAKERFDRDELLRVATELSAGYGPDVTPRQAVEAATLLILEVDKCSEGMKRR